VVKTSERSERQLANESNMPNQRFFFFLVLFHLFVGK